MAVVVEAADLGVALEVALEDEEGADPLAADLVVGVAEEGIATGTTSTPTVHESVVAPSRPRRAAVARLRTVRGRVRPRPRDAEAAAIAVTGVVVVVNAIISTMTGSAVLVTTATEAAREAGAVGTARSRTRTSSPCEDRTGDIDEFLYVCVGFIVFERGVLGKGQKQ